MRILHLSPHLSGGGAERQLSYLAPEMAKAGHEVHIAYLYEGPDTVRLPGVVVHQIAVRGNHDPMLFLKLRRLGRTIKPHIIQSWIPMMDTLAGLLSFIINSAWILLEQTSESAYKTFTFKQNLRTQLARRSVAIVANSPGGRLYWLGQGIPAQRLFIIPNATPFEVINRVKPWKNASEPRKTLMYAGRLIPSKNIDVLIKAIAEVRRCQNVLLLIAGEGAGKPDLMRLVERLKLEEAVRFIGYLQPRDLWAQMKAAAVFISLSGYEGMPNCVTEAIACSIPLVLSDIAGHRAFLDDESALLLPVDSVTEIAGGILHALEHRQEAARRAAKALEAIKDRTPALVAAEYLGLYARLVG